MTLRHMKILVEVYRQNSVTKAAQTLHLSQPSVSLALRELEDYYGVTLYPPRSAAGNFTATPSMWCR